MIPDASKRTDVGFWDALGMDEGGLPIHLPMGVTKDGQGPADGTPALHHYECWCPDLSCPLTRALKTGWRAGAREMTKRRSSKTKIYAPPREHPDSGKPVF